MERMHLKRCITNECCYMNDVYVPCDEMCDSIQPPLHTVSLVVSFLVISVILYACLLADRWKDYRRNKMRKSVPIQTEMNPTTVCLVIEPDNTFDFGGSV